MVKQNKNANMYFRTIDGQHLFLNIRKSQGCLCISIKNNLKVFSYKSALFLGFTICTCAMVLSFFYVQILLVLLMLSILGKLLFSIKEEKVLLVKRLGYQICRRFFIRSTITFIPYDKVQTIFINEVILRHRVTYIISLLVQEGKNQQKLVPLFKDVLPRLDCLEKIYKNIRHFEDS